MPNTRSPEGLSCEEIAFLAGWEATKTGNADTEGGREVAMRMFMRGFDFGDAEAGESFVRPDQGEASPWRHAANEWADMATGGLQWLRNVCDGVSTVDDALANMAECLAHCRAVSKDAAAPPVTVEGES